MLLQGFPSSSSATDHQCPLPWDIDEVGLNKQQLFKLMGNGMHMHVLALVMLWALSCNEVKKKRAERLRQAAVQLLMAL